MTSSKKSIVYVFYKFDIFLMRKDIHIVYLKKQKKYICHCTTFYSIFNIGSYRKPEIQNDLPKITKIKLICYFFTKTLTKICSFVNFSILNNFLIAFKNVVK